MRQKKPVFRTMQELRAWVRDRADYVHGVKLSKDELNAISNEFARRIGRLSNAQ